MAKPWLLIEHKDGRRFAVAESTYESTYAAQGFKPTGYEDGTSYTAPKRTAAATDADKDKDS